MRTIRSCIGDTERVTNLKAGCVIQNGNIAYFYLGYKIKVQIALGENGWDIVDYSIPAMDVIINNQCEMNESYH